MKKILTLACALAMVAGANAQVRQANTLKSAKAELKEKTASSILEVGEVKGAAKPGRVDTLPLESALMMQAITGRGWGMTLGMLAMHGVEDVTQNSTAEDVYENRPTVFVSTGTGFLNEWFGSGEIGYSFDFSPTGYYASLGLRRSSWGITGALTYVCRFRSPLSINDETMPLRFKLYTTPMGQVSSQQAYTDLLTDQARREQVDVYYPTDPDKFVSYSEEVQVPSMPLVYDEGSSKPYLPGDLFGARFTTPGIAGDHACISAMFPNNKDEKDTLWKASLLTVSDGAQGYATSDQVAPVYVVYDFRHQTLFGPDDDLWREREAEYFIPNEDAQPNTRYAVVPLMSWVWSDQQGNREPSIEEPVIIAILAEGVTIERGAYYDKYVEVVMNPAIDYTVLRATERINDVEIYNLNGKLVKKQACNNHQVEVRLDGLSSGMYVAKVTTDGGVANKKIMVR